jgi:MFS family permease
VLIAASNEGVCFLIDGISYIAVIVSLMMMRVQKAPAKRTDRRVLHDLREGLSYGFSSAPIRSVLALLALVSLMGVPYTVLMPVIAAKVLHGGAHTLGFLMGATGVGALGGAAFLASRKSVVGLGRIIWVSAVVFGIGLIAFSRSHQPVLSLALLLITGAGFMVQMAASNTVIQTIVREDMRGRVMSFYAMAFMGTVPFGSLFAGFLAGRIGAPNTVLMGGVACMIGGCLFGLVLPSLRVHVRPIYMERGIMEATEEA